ncbi:ComEA family DNA-binding protein [Paenibacillus macerans]|uniref:ComEA family DNA-binding protein n=1 Tax=Paenibacillus macerans TaxID=44252 RepID=UPI003D316ED5
MRREFMLTAVASAVVGAGLMLLAVGGGKPAGIEGWMPINAEVAATVDEQGRGKSDSGGAASDAGAKADVNREVPDAGQGSAGMAAEGAKSIPAAGTNAATGSGTHLSADGPGGAATGSGKVSASAAGADAASGYATKTSQISINRAGLAELQNLPGIGEKKAQAIIDYRNEHGDFGSVGELTKVKGIGDKMLEKMKPYIGL